MVPKLLDFAERFYDVAGVEEAMDVTLGHEATVAFVQKCLDAFREGRQTPLPSIVLK